MVVGIGRKNLGLFGGTVVKFDEGRQDATICLDTKRERSNMEQKEVLRLFGGIAGKDSLYSGTVHDSFIWVDALVRLFAIEEIGYQFHDTRNTSGATEENDFVNIIRLVNFGVFSTGPRVLRKKS